MIENETIEVVESLIFKGTEIDKTSNCSKELKRRLALGKTALRKLDKIWKSNDGSLGTKKRSVQARVSCCSVWSRDLDCAKGQQKENRCLRALMLEKSPEGPTGKKDHEC